MGSFFAVGFLIVVSVAVFALVAGLFGLSLERVAY
jgi:hypothetical protein